MNSYGMEFGDIGPGRVYFDKIFSYRLLYMLYADALGLSIQDPRYFHPLTS